MDQNPWCKPGKPLYPRFSHQSFAIGMTAVLLVASEIPPVLFCMTIDLAFHVRPAVNRCYRYLPTFALQKESSSRPIRCPERGSTPMKISSFLKEKWPRAWPLSRHPIHWANHLSVPSTRMAAGMMTSPTAHPLLTFDSPARPCRCPQRCLAYTLLLRVPPARPDRHWSSSAYLEASSQSFKVTMRPLSECVVP